MPPFQFPDGTLTRDAYKAMLLQLDPDDDEAERALRIAMEKRSQKDIAAALRKQFRELIPANATDEEVLAAVQRIRTTNGPVRDAVRRAIAGAAELGVQTAVEQISTVGITFDWMLPHTQAREWASRYAGELISRIDETTRRSVQASVSEWINNGEPLSALRNELLNLPGSPFGEARASLIASTETTRAYAEGAILSYRESGLIDREPRKRPVDDTHIGCRCELSLRQTRAGEWVYIWKTASDERVCEICGPLDGTEQ